MDYFLAVDVFQSQDYARDDKFYILMKGTCFNFGKALFVADMVPKVGSPQIIHHQVKILFVLEGLVNVHQKSAV